MGFGAPENANNVFFHVFGCHAWLSNAVEVHFSQKIMLN